ncbi:MAG TPA: hypothetical protein VFM01_04730 [Nakamurella sp.]|nr:hypothetical protein [Nakamurella sp.]
MTPNADQAHSEPLLTWPDMMDRIRELLAPAINPGQLWVLLLDSLRRQLPLMVPIDGCPARPTPDMADQLAAMLTGLLTDIDHGPASVIFVRERLGSDDVTDDDRCWAASLSDACREHDIGVTGIFLLTPNRIRPLSARGQRDG